jgi:serine/threonine protein kinase
MNDLHFGDVLGEGAGGTVFAGTWKSKGIPVALKRVRITPEKCDAKVMAVLGEHPNIISFYGFAHNHPETTIVTALAKNGSLYNYLHTDGNKPTRQQSVKWARHIAYGMAHMHKLELVHRDLKSSNVLFTNDMEAQICDFGTSRPLENTTYASKTRGTWCWMAPEVANEDAISMMCDVFSFCMVVWELIEHEVPFHDSKEFKASMRIVSGERPPFLSIWPDYLANLVEAGWSHHPHDRPSFTDIVTSLENEVYFRR